MNIIQKFGLQQRVKPCLKIQTTRNRKIIISYCITKQKKAYDKTGILDLSLVSSSTKHNEMNQSSSIGTSGMSNLSSLIGLLIVVTEELVNIGSSSFSPRFLLP